MRMMLVALIGAALASGGAQKQEAKAASAQKAQTAQEPAPSKQQPTSSGGQKTGCPGTRFPKAPCDAIIAEATLRQVDAALEQTSLTRQNNWLNLVTALVAGMAAIFAAIAAKASRDTVHAFTVVETADLVVTLEKFHSGTGGLSFKVIANNVGRSTALIVHAAATWHDSMDDRELTFAAPPKTYIVKASESVPLDFPMVGRSERALEDGRFFWLLLMYNSPLRGFRTIRYCFEVWGLNSNIPYLERYRREWDRDGSKRPWWRFWEQPQGRKPNI